MRDFAPAKVNLYLHVVGRRTDGYHVLDSLAVFPPVGDHLTATPATGLTLTITGPFSAGLQAEPDNLVLRAARALAEAAGVAANAAITLDKHLPIASGIGGGSADAAAALRLLARLWSIPAGTVDLGAIGARLGADIPVCLTPAPTRMGGIGEILSPAAALPHAGLLLVNPGVAVATPAVFRARTGPFSPPAILPGGWANAGAMAQALAALSNDLQPAAEQLCPIITEVLATLAALPGARLARMSGSGATCFAIFDSATAAETAAATLHPTAWWVWAGALNI